MLGQLHELQLSCRCGDGAVGRSKLLTARRKICKEGGSAAVNITRKYARKGIWEESNGLKWIGIRRRRIQNPAPAVANNLASNRNS